MDDDLISEKRFYGIDIALVERAKILTNNILVWMWHHPSFHSVHVSARVGLAA